MSSNGRLDNQSAREMDDATCPGAEAATSSPVWSGCAAPLPSSRDVVNALCVIEYLRDVSPLNAQQEATLHLARDIVARSARSFIARFGWRPA